MEVIKNNLSKFALRLQDRNGFLNLIAWAISCNSLPSLRGNQLTKRPLVLLSFFVAACTSPYAASNIPEIAGLDARLVDESTAKIFIADNFPQDCEYRRNAVLLKSAYIALANDYDHFEFSSDEDASVENYKSIKLSSNAPITVYLCRGTCPLMYSADALSHVLVSKFSRGTWSNPAVGNRAIACHLPTK